MTTRTVTTQAELDVALADTTITQIDIRSDPGVWLTITDSGSSRVVAWGSSRVVAGGSSRVVAGGSSRVVARDSSRVVARDSSSVVAWDSSSVVARDSSRVVARDSSRVEARDSSRVEAGGSSRVEAGGSSRVEAWDSSSVEAWDSSSVEAWDSSSVEAGKYVAVHLHSTRVTLSGGVVIDLTQLDMTDQATWLDFHGVKVHSGAAIFYKAVDADLNAGHGYTVTAYPVGREVVAGDWEASRRCGHGLHFGASPSLARSYYSGAGLPRFLEVAVQLEDLVVLDDKVKARACRVLREVDVHGDPVEAPVQAAVVAE